MRVTAMHVQQISPDRDTQSARLSLSSLAACAFAMGTCLTPLVARHPLLVFVCTWTGTMARNSTLAANKIQLSVLCWHPLYLHHS